MFVSDYPVVWPHILEDWNFSTGVPDLIGWNFFTDTCHLDWDVFVVFSSVEGNTMTVFSWRSSVRAATRTLLQPNRT